MDKKNKTDHDEILILKTKFDNVLGFGKVVVTVCITATLSVMAALWSLGGWLYNNSGALKAGIKAFYTTKGHGQ